MRAPEEPIENDACNAADLRCAHVSLVTSSLVKQEQLSARRNVLLG
jgi:hypothetical protein